jgi:hypothetical protein
MVQSSNGRWKTERERTIFRLRQRFLYTSVGRKFPNVPVEVSIR